MNEILIAVLVVGAIGLVVAVVLSFASVFFAVPVDERVEKLTEALSAPDVIQHLVQDNPWHPTYTKTIEEFQTYALRLFRQTGRAGLKIG